jgi:hypothetical protein
LDNEFHWSNGQPIARVNDLLPGDSGVIQKSAVDAVEIFDREIAVPILKDAVAPAYFRGGNTQDAIPAASDDCGFPPETNLFGSSFSALNNQHHIHSH